MFLISSNVSVALQAEARLLYLSFPRKDVTPRRTRNRACLISVSGKNFEEGLEATDNAAIYSMAQNVREQYTSL